MHIFLKILLNYIQNQGRLEGVAKYAHAKGPAFLEAPWRMLMLFQIFQLKEPED